MKKPIFDKLDFDIVIGFYSGFDSVVEIVRLLQIKDEAIYHEKVRQRVDRLLEIEILEVVDKKRDQGYRRFKVSKKGSEIVQQLNFLMNFIL